MTGTNNRLGIDLGGTKTEMILLDAKDNVLLRERRETVSDSYEDVLQLLMDVVSLADSLSGHKVLIGIGTPGAISPATGLLRNSNTVCLNGMPLKSDLQNRLRREIRMQNDANCFALSEARTGAGRFAHTVFGVIIGTGTGAGLVIDQHLLVGPQAIAGEWGHNPLPWMKKQDIAVECYCGKQGCIETFLSGPGLMKQFLERFGYSLTSREIVNKAGQGDNDCRIMMNDYFDQMARALTSIINIIDPDVIVLGGGMSNIEAIYETVPDLLDQYVFSDYCSTSILRAEHGDSSGVFGAAFL